MKKVFILAAAAITFAACTDENYLGENKEFTKTDNPIGFNMLTSATSRAELSGKAAADSLHNVFYVYGIKNESAKLGTIKADGTDANNVMNNYKVVYADGTAMSTTSNTEGWEYVAQALTSTEVSNYTPNADTEAQTIKYWDWGASDYTFTAFSVNPTYADKVKVEKIYLNTDDVFGTSGALKDKAGSEYNYGYKLTLTSLPTLAGIYLSDRVYIEKSSNETRTEHNKYGGQVNFKFRNFGAKVRAAFYETIPGYTVTIDKMYDATNTANTTNFVASCPNIADLSTTTSTNPVTVLVTYYDATNTTTKNQPKVTVSGTPTASATLKLGTGVFTTDGLAVDNTNPTWDKENGAYTFVLPQETNTTPMKITVDYTLTCAKTGEVIKVKGATAEVPAQYLQWKSNYAYTYMFKISDNTNGYSGTDEDPAGLYPITFDAMTIDNGNGSTDYITTVSEPSITTFGYNSTSNTYIASASAYPAGTDIYATVYKKGGTAAETLSASGKTAGCVNLYTVTCADASYITEGAVAEYLYEEANGTLDVAEAKLTAVTPVTLSETNFVSKVPGEDGVDIDPMSALKWTGAANTSTTPATAQYYAVEYITESEKAATYDEVESGTAFDATKTYYTKNPSDEFEKCENLTEFAASTTYYTLKTAYVPAKAQYKVVKVTAAE